MLTKYFYYENCCLFYVWVQNVCRYMDEETIYCLYLTAGALGWTVTAGGLLSKMFPVPSSGLSLLLQT